MMVNQWLMMANGHLPSLQMLSRYFVEEWSSKNNCCDHVLWVNESMIITEPWLTTQCVTGDVILIEYEFQQNMYPKSPANCCSESKEYRCTNSAGV